MVCLLARVSSGEINRVAFCGGNPDLAPLPNVFKFQRFLDTLARRVEGIDIQYTQPDFTFTPVYANRGWLGYRAASQRNPKLAAKYPAKMPHMGQFFS